MDRHAKGTSPTRSGAPPSRRSVTVASAGSSSADRQPRARRARGLVLLLGAVLIAALGETGTLAFYWFPLLTGLTYLVAAAASRSRGTLWAPGLIVTAVGVSAALWLREGRSADSFQFLAVAVLSLGLGGVVAGLLATLRGFAISAMSVALPVLLFGAFALAEQQRIAPFAGSTRVYVALLAVWGVFELRPSSV